MKNDTEASTSKGRYTLSVTMSDFICDIISDGKTE